MALVPNRTHSKDPKASSKEVSTARAGTDRTNRGTTSNRITIKIIIGVKTINNHRGEVDRVGMIQEAMKNSRERLKRLSTSFSRTHHHKGTKKNGRRKCLGVSKKDRRKIMRTGKTLERSMMNNSAGQTAQASAHSMINTTQLHKQPGSSDRLYTL